MSGYFGCKFFFDGFPYLVVSIYRLTGSIELSVNAFNKEEALARAFSGHCDCDTLRRIVYSSICSQRRQHHLARVYIAPTLHLPAPYCHHSHRWNFDPTPTTTTATTTTAITFLAQLMNLFGKTIFKLLTITRYLLGNEI